MDNGQMIINLTVLKNTENPEKVLLYLAYLEAPDLFSRVDLEPSVLQFLAKHKIIEMDYTTRKYKLRENNVTDDDIIKFVNTYRKKWGKIGVANRMGDKNKSIEKLKRWMRTNPEYSLADIGDAMDFYLANYSKYTVHLKSFDYFIYKRNNVGGEFEEVSVLSRVIDEKELNITDDEFFSLS